MSFCNMSRVDDATQQDEELIADVLNFICEMTAERLVDQYLGKHPNCPFSKEALTKGLADRLRRELEAGDLILDDSGEGIRIIPPAALGTSGSA